MKETIDMKKESRIESQEPPIELAAPRLVLWACENPTGTIDQCSEATGYHPGLIRLAITSVEFKKAVKRLYWWSKPKLLHEAERLIRHEQFDDAE